MAAVHRHLYGVRTAAGTAAGLLLLALASAPSGAQLPPGLGRAADFASVEYYEAPNELQMKTRISGAQSTPLPGVAGGLLVQDLKIENFSTNGVLEAVVTAPECIYSTVDFSAHSAGPLMVRSGDGKLVLTGRGFLWRQSEQGKSLTISNDVNTVISAGAVAAGLKK